MDVFLGVVWFLITALIAMFIHGGILKKKLYYKIGLTLIILSFICGFTMLFALIVFTI